MFTWSALEAEMRFRGSMHSSFSRRSMAPGACASLSPYRSRNTFFVYRLFNEGGRMASLLLRQPQQTSVQPSFAQSGFAARRAHAPLR